MENIRTLRKKHGLTQAELAKKLHVHQTAVSQWEKGRTFPDLEQLKELSVLFDVPMECIVDVQTIPWPTKDPLPSENRGVKIPVFGSVAAGIPIEAITDIEDYEEISEELAATGEFVALKIRGNSMEPMLLAGDTVIIRIQDTIENGEIAEHGTIPELLEKKGVYYKLYTLQSEAMQKVMAGE